MASDVPTRSGTARTWLRGLMFASALLLSGALAGTGLRTNITWPGFYRPMYTQQEALDLWCADGWIAAPPPAAECRSRKTRGLTRHQDDFERFRDELPEKALRPRPLHPGTTAVLTLLLALVVWFGFDRVWDAAARRAVAFEERLRRRREARGVQNPAAQPDVKISAHEIEARVRVFRDSIRVLLVGSVVVWGLFFASSGLDQDVTLPGFYRPAWTEQEVLDLWCSDGVLVGWPPSAQCAPGGRVSRIMNQDHYSRFKANLPQKWLRPRRPHNGTVGVVLLVLAGLLWRWFGPVEVRVRGNGVWFGRRFIQADDLRGVRVGSFLGRPRLILITDSGEIRSPPLRIPHWELEDLCVEIRALVPTAALREQAEADRARLEPKMRALRELP